VKIQYRLIFLGLTLAVLILVGYYITGNFDFITQDFWFASGFLMLILMALIDQPFFSTEANVFMNGTAGLSLLLVENSARDGFWVFFLVFCGWLVVSSYVNMALFAYCPNKFVKFRKIVSRLNQILGKPTLIFSAFFLWGVFRQVVQGSLKKADALFVFWAIFILLNVPEISKALSNFLDNVFRKGKQSEDVLGSILNVSSPNILDIQLNANCSDIFVGEPITFTRADGIEIGDALILDIREVSGCRLVKAAITNKTVDWKYISTNPDSVRIIKAKGMPINDGIPISYVDVGSTLDTLKFRLRPELCMQRGMIIFTKVEKSKKVYYQITEAIITTESTKLQNEVRYVVGTANQLGIWNSEKMHFEEFPWVPQAGELVFMESEKNTIINTIPDSQSLLGWIPKSQFPILADLNDLVTHNTAILGVTGSGKTYLALYLINEYIRLGIKVLVLDISREYFPCLSKHNPYPIHNVNEIDSWWNSDNSLGIYQFGDSKNFTLSTKLFVEKVFSLLSIQELKPGVTIPAKICIVLEEAHSLIPEFNQVSLPGDKEYVNGTAQKILQGRKYGIGSLIITQRTANVTKTILNQCNTIIALRCFDQTGLDFLKNYMGQDYATALTSLSNFNAVVVGKGSLSQTPVIFQIPNRTELFVSNENSEEHP